MRKLLQLLPILQSPKTNHPYTIGDTSVISGAVKAVVIGTPLTIQILDSNNNLVQIAQIDVSQDGRYAKSILASGPLWKASGTYTIKVQFGPTVTAQTTFTFQRSTVQISNSFNVKDPNSQQIFIVNYTINGGTVKDITIDPINLSLIVSINSTKDGSITFQIPRSLIDAKTNNDQDDSFIILIDDTEIKPQSDQSNNNYRIITMQFFTMKLPVLRN